MGNEKGVYSNLDWVILYIGIAGLIIIRILCLYQATVQGEGSLYTIGEYILTVAAMMLCCDGVEFAYANLKKHSYRIAGLWSLGVVLLLVIMWRVKNVIFVWGVGKIFELLWPLGTVCLAGLLWKYFENRRWWWKFAARCGYYGVVFFAAWILLEYFLTPLYGMEIDPVKVIYLVFVGCLAMLLQSKQRKRECLWSIGFGAVGMAAILWNHDRVREIAASLFNPLFPTRTLESGGNWLGYHLQMANGWISQDFSVFEEQHVLPLSMENEFAWTYQVQGIVLPLSILLLMGVVMVQMYRFLYQMPHVSKQAEGMYWALVGQNVLGILAGIFLITATDVNILLQSSGYDLASILIFLLILRAKMFPVSEECNLESKGDN